MNGKFSGGDIRKHKAADLVDRLLDDGEFKEVLTEWVEGEMSGKLTERLKLFTVIVSQDMAIEHNQSAD